MEFLAEILPNSEKIEIEAWEQEIDLNPLLEVSNPVKGINPFTGEPQLFHPAPGSASIRYEGKVIGSIEWSMDESSSLIVHGDRMEIEKVIGVAMHVADKLYSKLKLYSAEQTAEHDAAG